MPAQKSIPTSASGQSNPQKQTSSSKSPGLAVVKEKNQPKVKDQNDFKPKESRGLGVTGPAKTKEQTNQSKSHFNSKENINSKEKGKTQVPQQVMQTNVQTKNTGVDKASVSAKAKEQSSSSKNLLSSGAANKKEQNQTSQPKVKNGKKPQKNSEIGASAPAKTKDQTSPSKNPHIPREVVKSKKKQKLQNDVNKASVSAKAKQQSSSSKSLPSPGAPSKKEQNQMPQPKVKNDNKPQINSEIGASGAASPSKNPNIPREAVKSKQKQKLQNDVESKNMSVISTSIPGKCQDQPPKQEKHQKKEQKNSEVKDSVKVDSKKKKMKESNEPALRNEKEQHSQEKQLPEKLPLPSPPPPPPTPPPSSPPEQLPRQEKPTNSHQQDEQQIQPIEEQNINAALNREMLSKHQNLDSENIQSEAATIQQQHYQPPHPRKENTNLQQQYHHAQNQKEQKTSMQQQQQNTSKMKQQMHHPQHQPILLQQQPQQLLQCTFLPDMHPPGNVEVGGSPLLQYQPVPMSVNQATGPVWRTPRNPVDTRVMPNPAPGVIPQIPAGVVLQAPAHPSQQGTPFLQWEQQLKRQVKTSPERKISTLPQWMKPMVLQFQEDNTPVFIHPLSEQASIPINPCNITDEEEDQFEDLLESDVTTFVKAFPENIQLALWKLSQENSTCSYVYLAELVMDVGRQPKARYLKSGYNSELTEKVLNHVELTKQDMEDILTDNSFVRTCNGQVMIMDTLHRLGLLKNAQGEIIGMTAKVRHPLPGCLNPLYDVFNKNKSILVMGPTGVGKTTLLREAARVLSDSQRKSIFVIDTLSEIAGEGDIPHQSIGSARRLQVLESNLQHKVMKEAYQNHRPEIVIIDEISSPEEAEESLNMRLRGIQLIAGVQGQTISDILRNSDLSLVTGGIKESANVGNQGGKTARFRTGPVVFDILIEMLDRDRWIIHWDFGSAIDALLPGGSRTVGVEERKVAKLEEDDSGLVSQPVLAVQMLAEYQIYNQ